MCVCVRVNKDCVGSETCGQILVRDHLIVFFFSINFLKLFFYINKNLTLFPQMKLKHGTNKKLQKKKKS